MTPHVHVTTPLALALLGSLLLCACSDDSPDLPLQPQAVAATEDDGPPRYSDWSVPVNLGSIVNSPSVDIEVSLSKDGLSLYFASNRPGGFGGFDIYVTQRAAAGEPWGAPQNLGPAINSAFNDQGPAVTRDGHRMFFFSNRPGGSGGNDLYVARRRDKRNDAGWGDPANLGGGINTAFNEQLPHPFAGEPTGASTLYFNSNRPGGTGATDIYASALLPDDSFGPATLVAELSSPQRDAGIAIRRDGLELILGSDRPGTMGSFDLWVATRTSTSEPWSAPVNIPVLNSLDDEGRSALSFDGTELFIISGRPGGAGNLDVWVSSRSKVRP